MKDFIRKVNYHETDKMGITHHSNYIKFMEEARTDFLDKLGFGYASLERDGVVSPVIAVEGEYKRSTTFDDEIKIHVFVEEFKGVRLTIGYVMTNNKSGETVLTGRTKHCFLDESGKPIILKKRFPEFDKALKDEMNKTKETQK
ncbi:MAG: acyl-CoA thioesterase [Oscillospiraceae bacterium]|nr:acyl-CoA thioesterase [Oscillospiraceae bacterium]